MAIAFEIVICKNHPHPISPTCHPGESGVIVRNPKANPVRHCEEGQEPDAAIWIASLRSQ